VFGFASEFSYCYILFLNAVTKNYVAMQWLVFLSSHIQWMVPETSKTIQVTMKTKLLHF